MKIILLLPQLVKHSPQKISKICIKRRFFAARATGFSLRREICTKSGAARTAAQGRKPGASRKNGRQNLSRCPFVCGNTRLYPAFTASSVDFPRLTARTYPRSAPQAVRRAEKQRAEHERRRKREPERHRPTPELHHHKRHVKTEKPAGELDDARDGRDHRAGQHADRQHSQHRQHEHTGKADDAVKAALNRKFTFRTRKILEISAFCVILKLTRTGGFVPQAPAATRLRRSAKLPTAKRHAFPPAACLPVRGAHDIYDRIKRDL